MFKQIAAAAIAVAATNSAQAVTLFSQDFNGLAQAIPAGSVPGFTITGPNTVDIVTNGNFGIRCAGNTGACLDIDGTPGPGSVTSIPIAFSAGNRVVVSFDISGNQRQLATQDLFQFGLSFGSPTSITGLSNLSGFTLLDTGDFAGITAISSYSESIIGSRSFLNYALSFTPTTDGSLQLFFGSTSADNVGPILDNVVVSQVPEPASWAMLITGFGLVGATMRRRRTHQGSVSPA